MMIVVCVCVRMLKGSMYGYSIYLEQKGFPCDYFATQVNIIHLHGPHGIGFL